jgi:hypothetical protein
MKNHLRRKLRDGGLELGIIADVTANILNHATDAGESEHVGFGRGIERVSPDLRAQTAQPKREPTALETGVTGKKNTPSPPGFYRISQDALPLTNSSSSRRFSSRVSIACLHPRYGNE